MTANWKWKNKNGEQGGLLYESGNWGDILKMLWLATLIRWKEKNGRSVHYTDPFAGDVHYPLNEKLRFRLSRIRLPQLDFLQKPFFEKQLWPSAASAALLLASGGAEIWDADETRRSAWQAAVSGKSAENAVSVPQNIDSGWDIVSRIQGKNGGLLLVDPYDFLSGWREHLPLLLEKSGGENGVATLLYVYNRSGKNKETFQNYRRFRSVLDEESLRRNRPKRIARIAADAFLPDAHHELVLLPGGADAGSPGFEVLLEELAACAYALNAAQTQTGICDC